MKKISIIITLLSFAFNGKAKEIVEWKYSVKKIAAQRYEVHFTPRVQSPWHIYSLEVPGSIGLPTSFSFDKNSLIELQGKMKEIGIQRDFIQTIKLKEDTTIHITGRIKFMACTNEVCMPPQTVEFEIKIGGKEDKKTESQEDEC